MATNVGAKKRAGIVLIIVGIILLAVALVPSVVRVSSDGFSPARVMGLVTGGLIVLVGFVLSRRKGHMSEPPA
jgi:hypothetical protein